MKILILFSLLLIWFDFSAQTKIIAHKSHSGSNSSFNKAYRNNLFDINHSNFGEPGNQTIIIIDSIIAIDASVTIIKNRTSTVCHPFGTDYKTLQTSDFVSRTDTVINHDLFRDKNALETIKYQLPSNFWFVNQVEEITFIGFWGKNAPPVEENPTIRRPESDPRPKNPKFK
jgi:hypothetical protein